ncbi:MAG: sigma-70 family RNA polymerase sigma factor, partial [Chloroflexi bacterium]|nr:sigma-70 family RNA polymerase sigma factor [Chloroflexota bacterium]
MPSSDPMRSAAVHEAAAAERFDGFTDADLVELLAHGDARALRALYRRYSRPVYAMVLRMLRNEPTTEEVVQDAFVRVWRNALAYDPSRNFPTWLLGLAHNLAVDELRHRR